MSDDDQEIDQTYRPSDDSSSFGSSDFNNQTLNEERNDSPELTQVESQMQPNEMRSEESEGYVAKRKRVPKGQSDALQWKKNINIKKRRIGEEYEGLKLFQGKIVPMLCLIGPACTSNWCFKSKNKYCNLFTDADRLEIFNNFWENIDWSQKKVFVSALIDVATPKARTQVETEHYKKHST